jgi:hypothetical protein
VKPIFIESRSATILAKRAAIQLTEPSGVTLDNPYHFILGNLFHGTYSKASDLSTNLQRFGV